VVDAHDDSYRRAQEAARVQPERPFERLLVAEREWRRWDAAGERATANGVANADPPVRTGGPRIGRAPAMRLEVMAGVLGVPEHERACH